MAPSERRTSSPILLCIAGLLFATAPYTLVRVDPALVRNSGWRIAFLVVGLMFFRMAWDSHRRRAAARTS